MNNFGKFFWNPEFWLPKNITWDDLAQYNQYDRLYAVYFPIWTAVCLLVVRFLVERFIAKPVGQFLGIRENSHSYLANSPQLEKYFGNNHRLSESLYRLISRENKLRVEDVKNWFTIRRSLKKSSKLKKFTETSWRFVYYLFVWSYGLKTMYSKPWLWDTKQFWHDYPKHYVSNDIYWYYTLALGFNLSLLVSQLFDTRHKDFWQMFAHHLITIFLLVFSYACNFTRGGSLVLLLLESADFWLELAKLCHYVKAQTLCNILFGIFVIVWVSTRIVIFPSRIIYSATVELPESLGGWFPALILFNISIYLLQLMNLVWFYMICRMVFRLLAHGNIPKDDRSESDSGSERENSEGKTKDI